MGTRSCSFASSIGAEIGHRLLDQIHARVRLDGDRAVVAIGVKARLRAERVVDQEDLLLRADTAPVGLDHALLEHGVERVHVPQHALHEEAHLLGVARCGDREFTHRCGS